MLWRQPVEGASVFLAGLQFPADCLPSRLFSLLGLSSVPSTRRIILCHLLTLEEKKSVTSGRTRGKKKSWQDFLFPYFQTVGGKYWNVCLEFCVVLAAMKREFLEGKKSVFCPIIAIFNHREICSSWRFCMITFFPQICHLYQLWSFLTHMWTWSAW